MKIRGYGTKTPWAFAALAPFGILSSWRNWQMYS